MAGSGGRGRWIAASVVLAIATGACGGGDDGAEAPPATETSVDAVESGTRASGEVDGTLTIEVDGKRIEATTSECIVSESAITLRADGTIEGEPVVITVDGTATGDDWMLISRIHAADGSRRYQSSNASEIIVDDSTLRTTNEWVWDPTGEGDQASGDGVLDATCTSAGT